MTVKLALLKSGEEVISDIDEMKTDREIVVGYYFTNPCRAILTTPEIQVDESLASDKKPVAIKLLPSEISVTYPTIVKSGSFFSFS